MQLKEFAAYHQRTNIGASVVVSAPLGQYDPAKLVNVGTNRWAFKPEVGISHASQRTRLILDGYVGTIDSVKREDRQSNSRIGVTFSVPVTRRQALKWSDADGAITRIGGDLGQFPLAISICGEEVYEFPFGKGGTMIRTI
jgi:hypothetical protein